jgi:hypothetical protein
MPTLTLKQDTLYVTTHFNLCNLVYYLILLRVWPYRNRERDRVTNKAAETEMYSEIQC